MLNDKYSQIAYQSEIQDLMEKIRELIHENRILQMQLQQRFEPVPLDDEIVVAIMAENNYRINDTSDDYGELW
jgi:hypothetical protein